jgi:lipoprotein-anchoring transpeptidase ErfK/SrfK
MVAWQKGTSVLNVLISSGIPMFPTPTGTFHIYGKSRVTEMKGELGTPFAYDLPNVQWVSWWLGSYSIHGTYWHHNFGHVMSHGCVNATNADAQFIYNWAPVGTAVVVHR